MDIRIHFIRGQRVMLDSDLAKVYGVATKRLKEQFKRNRNRFPEDFAFQLTPLEFAALRSQIATSNIRGGTRYCPLAFTEHGAIMLASILNSQRAVKMSVFVVRAFVQMRGMLAADSLLSRKLAELENRVGGHDKAIASLLEAIRELIDPSLPDDRREIGFHIKEQATRYRTRNGN